MSTRSRALHHCNTVVDHRIDGWFRTAELFYTSQILFFDVFPHRKGEYFHSERTLLSRKGILRTPGLETSSSIAPWFTALPSHTTFFVPLNWQDVWKAPLIFSVHFDTRLQGCTSRVQLLRVLRQTGGTVRTNQSIMSWSRHKKKGLVHTERVQRWSGEPNQPSVGVSRVVT